MKNLEKRSCYRRPPQGRWIWINRARCTPLAGWAVWRGLAVRLGQRLKRALKGPEADGHIKHLWGRRRNKMYDDYVRAKRECFVLFRKLLLL